MGALSGCTTIAQAIEKKHLFEFITKMLDEEIKPVIVAEYPKINRNSINTLCEEFIERCRQSTEDPVVRVGRDPLRKLNQGGRIRGIIELAEKNNLRINFDKIEYGIAAGFIYAPKNIDPTNKSSVRIQDIFKSYKNNYYSLLNHNEENFNFEFTGFDAIKDQRIIKNIINKMKNLNLEYEQNNPTMTSNEDPDYFDNKQEEVIQKLNELGISVDKSTGHLVYMPSFTPINLSYEVVFIRHGETYGNCGQTNPNGEIDFDLVKTNKKDHEKRIFQGDVDAEINQLTGAGKEQAESLVEKLDLSLISKNWIPDAIISSPLKRAYETCLPFINKLNFEDKLRIKGDVREMSFGEWDNRRVCDLDSRNICHLFYKNQNALVKKSGINGNGEYQEAENFCEVLLRARDALLALNNNLEGKKVMMFSHSMFSAACCILVGKGQNIENDFYLAFDGKKSDGTYYTMPHATPFLMNFSL